MKSKSLLVGNAVVGQSGGCTAVINQSLAGVVLTAKKSPQIKKIYGSRHGVEGIIKEDFIELHKKPLSLINAIANLPSSALGSSRYKIKSDDEEKIIASLKRHNIKFVFLIGGNDTANTSLQIAQAAEKSRYELKVIHIPKTIDNDLMETDHCPGFGSVARFAAITTQEAALDTRAMKNVDPVKIIEFMGRNSGWIVASSALLKNTEKDAPHIILVPEVAFDETRFISQVRDVLKNVGYCVITMSETICDKLGNRVGAKIEGVTKDPFGHGYVEGAAAKIASIIEKKIGVRARFDKPGTIQRMSIPYISKTDQTEAFSAGSYAVRWATQGLSKVMVGFKRNAGKKYSIKYVPVPLEKIPNNERDLPPSFFDKKKGIITPAFKKYALPLLGKNLPTFPML